MTDRSTNIPRFCALPWKTFPEFSSKAIFGGTLHLLDHCRYEFGLTVGVMRGTNIIIYIIRSCHSMSGERTLK